MRLDNMSLLKEFHISLYFTILNLQNLRANSFETGTYFKDQLLKKKKKTVPTIFWKNVLF